MSTAEAGQGNAIPWPTAQDNATVGAMVRPASGALTLMMEVEEVGEFVMYWLYWHVRWDDPTLCVLARYGRERMPIDML